MAILKYVMRRLLNLIPVLIIISMLLFGLSKLMPGDPVLMMMPQTGFKTAKAKQEMYETIQKKYGFDKSIPEQYVNWVVRTVKGDLGESTKYRRPVTQLLGEPLVNTLILNIGVTILSFLISLRIGIKSAVGRGSFYDKFWQVVSLVGISLPTFFFALILIYFFSFQLGWLPPGQMPRNIHDIGEWTLHLILPTLTLLFGSLASTSRYVRNSMLDALGQDYIRTARAKGLSERKVIYSHAFRNALIPVVTIVAWSITGLLGGAAITETVFSYNGIGRFLIASVIARDYNVVMALNMMYAVLSVLGNLLMDIGYSLVDPRVRLE